MFVTVCVHYAECLMRLFLWQETNRPVLLLGWVLEFFCCAVREEFLFLSMACEEPTDFLFDALPPEL